jgi:aspartate kinase
MKVFKFGGASLKNAAAIRNMVNIVERHLASHLLIVVSAMGKTTNTLEEILNCYWSKRDTGPDLELLKEYHATTMHDLFKEGHPVFAEVERIFQLALATLEESHPYDVAYDQLISCGELISSTIVHYCLLQNDLPSVWTDARQYVSTDESFREGKVDWELTGRKIKELSPVLATNIILTQGFIGRTSTGLTTTLGREGSDFSAAIFASALNAKSVTIWKDVPGVMSADPKRLPNATVFAELPYQEAAEMTYYGASVIHPKTIKPLANRKIPLWVKNFDNPNLEGTLIHDCTVPHLPPLIVFKDNQCLVSCRVTDYTFINEQQLAMIFEALSSLDIKINVMQNSAISFSFCIDFRESKIPDLIQKLRSNFEVYYNAGLTLITIKNYDTESFETYRKLEGLLLEQFSRSTLQVLIKSKR